MPIAPVPRTYACTKCNWSKTVAPIGDALGPGDHFTECPKCGHEELKSRPADAMESVWASGMQTLERLWKP